MLCLYKQWHQLLACIKDSFSQGTTYLYLSFRPAVRRGIPDVLFVFEKDFIAIIMYSKQ